MTFRSRFAGDCDLMVDIVIDWKIAIASKPAPTGGCVRR
jgi:hypothetical protein